MGVPIHYGTCEGGPFHGKQMAHATETHRVAIDIHSQKVAVGIVAGAEYNFGDYTWDGGAWVWEMIPSAPKT